MTDAERLERLVNDLDFRLATVRTMETYGGSFAQALAKAAVVADFTNLKILMAAYLGLFGRYDPVHWA